MLISSNHLPINSLTKLDANHDLSMIQATIITQITEAIQGKLMLDDLLPSLTDQLSDILQASGCLIFRADQFGQLAASTKQADVAVEEFWLGCQDFCKYYQWRLAQGKLTLISATDTQLPIALQEVAKKGNLSSLLIVPFLHRQAYIGGLVLYQCGQQREWVAQEIAFVEAIAAQCAIALALAILEERCQLEAQRRQNSETRLQAFCNQTHQLICLLTPQGMIVEANQTVLAFVELPEQAVLRRPFWELPWWLGASGNQQQAFSERLRESIHVAAQGEVVRYEADILGSYPSADLGQDRTPVTLDIALTPHRDQTGLVVLLVFEGREITVHKQAQLELQENIARNKALLAAIPDLILRLSRSGIYLDGKTARADFLGMPIKDCIGKHLHQVLPPSVAALIWAHVDLALRFDEIQIVEYQLLLHEKSHVFEARIVKSGTDEVVAIVQDITERVQARVALEQINQALEIRVQERTAALREANHILRSEIVDRKKAQVQLQESEERFRQAVLNAPFPIIIYASDGEIVQINQVWTELTGYVHEEIPTISAWAQLAAGYRQKVNRSKFCGRDEMVDLTTLPLQNQPTVAHESDLNEQIGEGEFSLVTKNGDHRIWYFRSAPSGCLTDGRSLTISMAIDITERKQAERAQHFLHSVTQAIFESQDFTSALKVALEEVCEATGWAIGEAWVPRADGNVLECSPAWYSKGNLDTFHRASEQLTFAPGVGLPGRVWLSKQAQWRRDIASESDENFFRLQLAKLAGLQSGLGIPLFTTTGVLAVLVFYMYESRDEDERFTELISASTELGLMIQRKQAEGEVRKAFSKEKELTELKSRFISMASHEFRTPLTTIQSSAELLEYYSQKWSHDKKVTHLRRIQTSVKHMTKLLNDVLIIGRAEAGKLTFNPAVLNLESFCRNLVEELQLNDTHQHTISFVCEQEREEFANIETYKSQIKLPYIDETLLWQILENLLSNAIKYSPKDSIIEFKLQYSSTQAVFQICDQGIGIPPEDQPLLFESFHRATNVGTIAGTGLGLAIVKKCVDIHQGQVAVTSEIGVGTTFTVTLPI
jgi:signal transduction histidine kinase/PAS domain-containing protein